MLNNVIKELGLVDHWRHTNPKGKDFTFYSNPHGSYSRIDLFYVPWQHLHKVVRSGIEPITISDHAPLMLTLEMSTELCFQYWRMNVSILSDKAIIKIKNNLEEYFQMNNNGEVTLSTLWDAGKAVIRGKILEITSRLKKGTLKQQSDLERTIKELEVKHRNGADASTLLKLKKTRQKLDELNILNIQSRRGLTFHKPMIL